MTITKVMTIHDSFVMTITKVMTTRDSFVTPIPKAMTASSPTSTTFPNQGTDNGNSSTSLRAPKNTTHDLPPLEETTMLPHKIQVTHTSNNMEHKRDLERNMDRVIKAYTANDDKYSGEEDDFFRPKLSKSQEHCKAAEYYTGTIAPNRPGINDMIAQIQTHFETEANFELFEGQWEELTFHKVVKENPDKSLDRRGTRKIVRRIIPPGPTGYEIEEQAEESHSY
ncbi:hypothetical protein E4U39_004405 [Claviceps sp. Clav50 group G5]|nr:hypothetical protein E4U39_004405 [Claviceps sp. Clav50 group G5]